MVEVLGMTYNNPINALTSFAGTHTCGAASPLCPTCLRPLLESYVLMEKPTHLLTNKPIFILGIPALILILLAVLFQFAVVTGIEKGTLEGKVYSISQRPLGGGNQNVRKVDLAKVKILDGTFIMVRCESYCQLDQEIKVTVYKPLFSSELRYVYERT